MDPFVLKKTLCCKKDFLGIPISNFYILFFHCSKTGEFFFTDLNLLYVAFMWGCSMEWDKYSYQSYAGTVACKSM